MYNSYGTISNCLVKFNVIVHRRRIKTVEKAKVVAVVWRTYLNAIRMI